MTRVFAVAGICSLPSPTLLAWIGKALSHLNRGESVRVEREGVTLAFTRGWKVGWS